MDARPFWHHHERLRRCSGESVPRPAAGPARHTKHRHAGAIAAMPVRCEGRAGCGEPEGSESVQRGVGEGEGICPRAPGWSEGPAAWHGGERVDEDHDRIDEGRGQSRHMGGRWRRRWRGGGGRHRGRGGGARDQLDDRRAYRGVGGTQRTIGVHELHTSASGG